MTVELKINEMKKASYDDVPVDGLFRYAGSLFLKIESDNDLGFVDLKLSSTGIQHMEGELCESDYVDYIGQAKITIELE